ncbi:TRM10 [Sanghuangporus weigelae]
MTELVLTNHGAIPTTLDNTAATVNSPPTDAPQDSPSQPSLGQQQEQPLSKKAQKRAAKAAFIQERKLERRQRERAARKEKQHERRERFVRGELDHKEGQGDGRGEGGEPVRKKARKSYANGRGRSPFKARVVVDLGFDSYMTDKEISSLGSQLAYCYSANRKATQPFESLLFTSLSGRLHARLERENNAGYKRWTDCEWWEEGYDRLWGEDLRADEASNAAEGTANADEKRSRSSKNAVVYLTSDADDELEELKEGETYILGGIVDRNRHKFLCQKKAAAQGIRTARLPIGKFLKELKTRKVLTVNQVFEILIHWVESRNWEEAIYSVMPKRKFTQQSGKPQIEEKGPQEKQVVLDEAELVGNRTLSSEGDESASERGNEE